MDNLLMQHFRKFGQMSDEEAAAIDTTLKEETYEKGTVLLREGQFSNRAFFVAEGIVRKFYLMGDAEKTSDFFTEGEWVVSSNAGTVNVASTYTLECATACRLIIGDSTGGEALYAKYPNLGNIARKLMESVFRTQQDKLDFYMSATAEDRYQFLVDKKPHLLERIPQYQIAGYVGVTPESLSRIRKRIARSR